MKIYIGNRAFPGTAAVGIQARPSGAGDSGGFGGRLDWRWGRDADLYLQSGGGTGGKVSPGLGRAVVGAGRMGGLGRLSGEGVSPPFPMPR